MKKQQRLIMRTVILVVLLAALGYALYSNIFMTKEAVAKGDQAPDFVLTDLEGNTHRLSDYKGQGVFLNFWGTWCKPCELEMPYMNNQYQYFKDKGVEIIAVDIDESEFSVKKFVDKHGLTFPVVIDEDSQVMNAYDVGNLPTTFLIDKDGKVVDIVNKTMSESDVKQYMESIIP
ncbi:thiol-disulfide oxidoreductase ResA [Cytobacillus sp. IB215665]|uniref:thiol-disulfide oxidoreductase ResA n=1 Tax=Cytobacillus sp. IB215665 TaxID=3097357 RepID=UPI002A0D2389|nr:thiol-disulfide oxidoreductase ResA [Cytobacillus sp. IB215665]MDX8364792.1 thiol-disulfide oxidoreductase ResA [Cytobacillus sp. IB215665]